MATTKNIPMSCVNVGFLASTIIRVPFFSYYPLALEYRNE